MHGARCPCPGRRGRQAPGNVPSSLAKGKPETGSKATELAIQFAHADRASCGKGFKLVHPPSLGILSCYKCVPKRISGLSH
jgi:hypothetical protein